MVDWTDLPHEILDSIFSQLIKKQDISQCQMTCQNWYKAAEQVLYREVILSQHHSTLAFIRKITQPMSETGKHIKIVRVFYDISCDLNLNLSNGLFSRETANQVLALFSSMAKYCPYLEVIDTCHNPEPMWKLLQQESKHWKYIKEIPKVGWDGGDLNTYFDTALLYRNTLKSLYLGDRNYFTGWDDGPRIDYLKIARRLNEFTNLTCLEVVFATTAKSILILENLINACPSLIVLKFTPTFFDQSRYFGIENPLLINLSDDHAPIQPHYNLKTFEGKGVQFTSKSTDYFIHKFPNLENLVLNQFLNQDSLHQSDQVMKLMAQYITSIKDVTVYNTLDIRTMGYFMQQFLSISGLKTVVEIQYDDYDVHQSGGICYPYLVIAKKKKILLQVHFKSYNNTSLPHTALFDTLGPNIIKELHLNLGKKIFSCDLGLEINNSFQKHMGLSFYQLTRCLQLKVLQLRNINLYHIEEKKCKTNTSVHTLEFEKDELSSAEELDGLKKISKYFIGLKHVHFNIQYNKLPYIKIKMPCSHLEEVSWKINNYSLLVLLSVHEIMNSSKTYFSFTRDDPVVREISSQEFQILLDTPSLRLEVQCYSLKSFIIQYRDIYKQCIL